LAGHIQTHADKEVTVFWGTIHRDNLAAFAELLGEQITQPRLAEEDFTRLHQDALDAVAKTLRGNDDEDLGKQALASMIYPGHPYGYPTVGTVEGLKAITLEDVKQFYRAHFTRDRLIVGLAGGYSATFPAQLVATLERLPARG